jgi:hydrogenase/urease accessory protein HupE
MAHSPMAGIGEFYGGMLHPLLVLSHALALLVFALMLGQRGTRAMRFAYPPYILALAVGLTLAGFEVQPALPFQEILLLMAMLCGLGVAAQRSPPEVVLAAIAAVTGLLVGMDSGVTGLDRRETFAALLGCWLGATLLLVLLAGVAEMAQQAWQHIALRIIGSWTTACAVLVLALEFRPIT